MGQRQAILHFNYETNKDGSATLLVSQLPPNPNAFAPGPALLYDKQSLKWPNLSLSIG